MHSFAFGALRLDDLVDDLAITFYNRGSSAERRKRENGAGASAILPFSVARCLSRKLSCPISHLALRSRPGTAPSNSTAARGPASDSNDPAIHRRPASTIAS